MCNVLVGTAIGDALGVPFETFLINNPVLIEWDGSTFLGSKYHGLEPAQYSDDTQMSIMVAESLVNNGFNPNDLSQRYVDWFFSGSARGYGKTTQLALTSIKNGKHWSESGIVGSLGNGTAMRAAPFGVYFRNDIHQLIAAVKIDSAITHVSEDAEAGALAIALAAYYAVNHDTEFLLDKIWKHLPDCKLKKTIFSLDSLINSDDISAPQALRVLGTKANVQETVPAALYCFLKFNNYHEAIVAAIKAGGDTDTTAAIVGALFGAQDGLKQIDSKFHVVEDFDKLMNLDNRLYNRTNNMFFPRNHL
jgi:ADP-ribosylglycohydrolase